MGQTIEIRRSRRIGDVLVVDTDRSLAGQEGEAFQRDHANPAETFPAQLARRLFDSDPELERVHVMSNAASLKRRGGWDDESEADAHSVVTRFFRHYPD